MTTGGGEPHKKRSLTDSDIPRVHFSSTRGRSCCQYSHAMNPYT